MPSNTTCPWLTLPGTSPTRRTHSSNAAADGEGKAAAAAVSDWEQAAAQLGFTP